MVGKMAASNDSTAAVTAQEQGRFQKAAESVKKFFVTCNSQIVALGEHCAYEIYDTQITRAEERLEKAAPESLTTEDLTGDYISIIDRVTRCSSCWKQATRPHTLGCGDPVCGDCVKYLRKCPHFLCSNSKIVCGRCRRHSSTKKTAKSETVERLIKRQKTLTEELIKTEDSISNVQINQRYHTILAEALECPGCRAGMYRARKLNCGHSLCEDCMRDKFKFRSCFSFKILAEPKAKIECPKCKVVTKMRLYAPEHEDVYAAALGSAQKKTQNANLITNVEKCQPKTTALCMECKKEENTHQRDVFMCSTCRPDGFKPQDILCSYCALQKHAGHQVDKIVSVVPSMRAEALAKVAHMSKYANLIVLALQHGPEKCTFISLISAEAEHLNRVFQEIRTGSVLPSEYMVEKLKEAKNIADKIEKAYNHWKSTQKKATTEICAILDTKAEPKPASVYPKLTQDTAVQPTQVKIELHKQDEKAAVETKLSTSNKADVLYDIEIDTEGEHEAQENDKLLRAPSLNLVRSPSSDSFEVCEQPEYHSEAESVSEDDSSEFDVINN
ncbi:hypothetical protein L596_017809 [Steinernema carpocapsae]|uniref:RING-type domain-containing protein n=1 Tax=Steinernema carpocapsae TaxID=34508 RepID=A0A4U5N3G2_STECR|nr:hypothetical protein L596_017809 [Steinernema carpocapsae]